jgi:uncharacterized membrane protein
MTDTSTSSRPGPAIDCPACRVLDAADGTSDGRFYTPPDVHVQHEKKLLQSVSHAQDRAADVVTAFAGSLRFVYLHSIWFALWVAANVGILGTALIFDEFPFGLLTMIVSLEAIFLSTFVMVSQNRQAKRADIRSQLDFETNLRAEVWAIHIGAQLGIDHEHVEDVVHQIIHAATQPDGTVDGQIP